MFACIRQTQHNQFNLQNFINGVRVIKKYLENSILTAHLAHFAPFRTANCIIFHCEQFSQSKIQKNENEKVQIYSSSFGIFTLYTNTHRVCRAILV